MLYSLKIRNDLSSKIILLILFAISSLGFTNSDTKNVLVISSYHPGFPTFFEQIDGIKSVFTEEKIHFDIEFMDSKRFPEAKSYSLFCENLCYKINKQKPYDAIITCDDNALHFALQFQDSLFAQIPIVFCGVNNIDLAMEQDKNKWLTGIIESVSMKETQQLMIDLFPDSKTIYAIADSTTSGQEDLKTFYAQSLHYKNKTFKHINTSKLNINSFKDSLKQIPTGSPVLLLSAYLFEANKTLNFKNSLQLISENLQAPVFHLWNHGMGDGIIGGKIISQFEEAKNAASIVRGIIKGNKIENLKVIAESPNIFVFDYKELEKHHISINQLPAKSHIINRPNSFMVRNKKLIRIGSIVFASLVVFIILLILIIAHQKRVEVKLQIAMKKAEESDKLKSAFLANMSHEIRTPMNGILGFLDLLQNPDLTSSKKNSYSKLINESGERLLNTINDIIDYSKIEAGDIPLRNENFSVSELFSYYFNFYEPLAKEKNLTLIMEVPEVGTDISIESDKTMMDSILSNLLNNALKFTEKGVIKFGYKINNKSNNKELICYVSDTGAGIAKDKQDLIFKRFIHADNNITRGHEGSGLGLAICKAYIEKMGGKIGVESELGKGSKFIFSLMTVKIIQQ